MRTLFYLPVMVVLAFASCNSSNEQPSDQKKEDIVETRKLEGEALVKRGDYLVTAGGCNDCHTPKIMTPQGPVFDTSRSFWGAR